MIKLYELLDLRRKISSLYLSILKIIMLKRLSTSLCLLFIVCSLSAQILEPVKWQFKANRTSLTDAELIITAKIEKGWHIYSNDTTVIGPVPTTFYFKNTPKYTLNAGIIQKSKIYKHYDEFFLADVEWFEDEAIFVQKIKLKSKDKVNVKSELEYMVCDSTQCLPPEFIEFQIKVPAYEGEEAAVKVEENEPETPKEEDSEKSKTPWGIFIAGFFGGLLALLTPCVFPMIPLTVSYFTKSKDKSRGIINALIYGVSIILIYVALGLGVTFAFGSDALNALASNGIFNLSFFLILVFFAISFFGAFEIVLPSKWVNSADEKADKGGLLGIFFMAFTLALVSFSCTGPIIGTLLVEAAVSGSAIGPAIGMAGFSLALAIPFTLFAIFPKWMTGLPKSGGWLNSVKVVLGFLELALAMKFLSNVDLAYHWGVFDREVFLVLWIVIFAMLGFYLLGKLRFSHDSPLQYISIPRLFMSIAALAFAIYMVPGLWGAPLKAISAFLPPSGTQDFDLYTPSLSGGFSSSNSEDHGAKKYGDRFHAPLGLNSFFDYEEGMAHAKKVGKPVMIDFTGHSCVNCRKMEASVWPDREVLRRIKQDYVLIQLYVDDKLDLDESEQYLSEFSGKKIRTLGNKWSDLQASTFGINSQPYYVLLDHEENTLVTPRSYDQNIEEYVEFLDKGKVEFEKRMKK
ncbi:MAG: thiol:disulfide interchange protein [Sphingobacteriales bacterium]